MRPKLFLNLVMYVWRDLYKIILVTIKHFDLYQKIKVMQYHATSYISYFDLDSYLTCLLLYELFHIDTAHWYMDQATVCDFVHFKFG